MVTSNRRSQEGGAGPEKCANEDSIAATIKDRQLAIHSENPEDHEIMAAALMLPLEVGSAALSQEVKISMTDNQGEER